VKQDQTRPPIELVHNEKAREIIKSCWSGQPEKRPSFAKIVEDFREIGWQLLPDVDLSEIDEYVWSIEEFERIRFGEML
jgi:hypothetical protein